MNTQLGALYQEASDFFTYVKLYAPEFPPRDDLTCQKAVSRLYEYVVAIDDLEQNSSAKNWLRVCREVLKSADKLFEDGQHSQGRRALGSARDYLVNAEKRRSMKPTFIVGEAGFAE